MLDENRSARDMDFGHLVKHAAKAYLVGYRQTKSFFLAEEAVQEAFVSFLRHPPAYQGSDQMRNCFLMKVSHCARDLCKKECRRRLREEAALMQPPFAAREPQATTHAREATHAARAAMNILPLEERTAVCLCCEAGLTQSDVAEILRIPKQTVSRRLHRGLEKLRRILIKQGFGGITPVSLAAVLEAQPALEVPASLMKFLNELAADPSLAAKYVAKVSARRPPVAAPLKSSAWWLGAAVAGVTAVFGGVFFWNRPQPNHGVERLGANGELYRLWSFKKGPAADLVLVRGAWSFQAGSAGKPGGMVTAPNQMTHVRLPQAVPPAPLKLRVSGRFMDGVGLTMSGYWEPGAQDIDEESWHVQGHYRPGERMERVIYFFERWVFVLEGNALEAMREYGTRYPRQHVLVTLKNINVEEIELAAVAATELPVICRNPDAFKALLQKKGAEHRRVRKSGDPSPPVAGPGGGKSG